MIFNYFLINSQHNTEQSVAPEVFCHENFPQPLSPPQEPLTPPGPPLHLFPGLSLSSSVRPDPWVPEVHEDEARGRKTGGRTGPCQDVHQQGQGHPKDDASQELPQRGTLLKRNNYEHICINGFLRAEIISRRWHEKYGHNRSFNICRCVPDDIFFYQLGFLPSIHNKCYKSLKKKV